MGHRAAVYSVCVHVKRKTNDCKPLGSIDGAGAYLGDALTAYLEDFSGANADGSKRVHCDAADQNGDYIFIHARHGQSGVSADIVNSVGDTEFHQRPDHEHVLPSSSLFYLPREQSLGWWVVHNNNGRSTKGLLQARMLARFKEDYGDLGNGKSLMLKIAPVVSERAFRAAVEQNRVEKLRLRRLKRPDDIAAIERWVPASHKALVSVEISTEGKGARVLVDPIRRFLKGETDAIDEIVEFNGLTFEEASATVILPNGRTRTFNIETPEVGHTISQDLDGLVMVDGEPTESSLEAELRRSLEVTLGQL